MVIIILCICLRGGGIVGGGISEHFVNGLPVYPVGQVQTGTWL